ATREHFSGREFLSHGSLLFFIWPQNKGLNGASLVNPFAKVSKKLPGLMGERAEHFEKAVRDAVHFLDNSPYFKMLPFNQAALIHYTDAFFNGFNPDFDTDTVLDQGEVKVGDQEFGVLAVNHES